ncbi:MAG: ATP-binding protein [Bacteroidetes bacterium]|nr:ATP-binding protein [Bacteroidota bacterium]
MHKPNFSSNDYWLVDVRLNIKTTRDKISNPFAISLANNVFGKPKNTFLDLVDKEKFIRDIFNKRGATADDAGLISRAISKLAGDMYSDLSERFVFELLQNADDMPKDKNGVNVKLHLLENNILFIHNGLPFSKEDIKAITDIGNSTKKKNPSQTGYKGIGFKIVFQESENVLIKSGGFSFSFDKNTTDVAIAINTDRVNQFRTDITSLIQEPRFILFLRNIKSIKIDGINNPIEITKTKSEKAISLKSNNEHLSDWLTFDDIEIKISEEVKEAILSDKAVPPKLKEISSTKLNFICQLVDGKIIPVAPEESYLFTYLPTDVKDYKFPFLVNADFLTTANRQSIHVKNKWNLFLFEEIGKNCLKWIAEVSNSSYKASAYNLLPNSESSVNDQPWEAFYKGYTKAIDETEFVLSESGKLVKLKDVCIDNTGFSKYVDSLTFKTLFSLQGELLSNEITDVNPIVCTVEEFGQGKIIKITDLIQSISNENFKAWLTNPANNIVFIRYLINNRLLDLLASNELFLSKDLKLFES